MWDINREQAKSFGYTDQEIDAFLAEKNKQVAAPVEPPSPISPLIPVPGATPTPIQEPVAEQAPVTSDVVDPFKNPLTTEVTQYMGENPGFYGEGGHQGVDMVNSDPSMTNPIGGTSVSGYQPGGFGYWNAMIGGNPQELAQQDPAQRQADIDLIRNYMATATDIRGLEIPGKNVTLQGHMQELAPEGNVATGSANLTMGGTGGWDPHLHQEMKDTTGEMTDVQKIIGSYPKSEMYYGPSIDFNQMATEQIKKRLGKK